MCYPKKMFLLGQILFLQLNSHTESAIFSGYCGMVGVVVFSCMIVLAKLGLEYFQLVSAYSATNWLCCCCCNPTLAQFEIFNDSWIHDPSSFYQTNFSWPCIVHKAVILPFNWRPASVASSGKCDTATWGCLSARARAGRRRRAAASCSPCSWGWTPAPSAASWRGGPGSGTWKQCYSI